MVHSEFIQLFNSHAIIRSLLVSQLMPGGVSSPVRAFKSVGGNPVVFDRVKGAYAWDVDGNKYIDYVGTWGPAILGHADDDVLDAVKKTMDKGKSQSSICCVFHELSSILSVLQQSFQEPPSEPPALLKTSLPRLSSLPFPPLKWSVSPTLELKPAWV